MRSAFSLVEVMIALALGMIILATVYAGFRVATQSVIACNRMSVENRLLTAGMARALDETDFWTKFDRPGWKPAATTPTKKITWAGEYSGSGSDSQQLPQPFTPFSASWKEPLNDVPAAQNAYDARWLPHEPRSWYRGDGRLYLGGYWYQDAADSNRWKFQFRYADDAQFGNYGLFSGSTTTVQHRGAPAAVGATGATDEQVTWYASQQRGLKYALGFYGWWEYLPANAPIDWYERDGTGRATTHRENASRYDGEGSAEVNDDGTFGAFKSVNNVGRFSKWINCPWPSFNERPVTRSAFLWEHVLGICAPRPAIGTSAADNVNDALRLNRWMGGMRWYGWEYQSAFNLLSKELTRPEPLVVSRPRDWPQVTWDVRRYKMYSRTVNDCYVRVFDPLTAKMVEINFRTVGTTLRGARLQRRHPAFPNDLSKCLDD